MDWHQKAVALNNLAPLTLRLGTDNRWVAHSAGVEIGGDGLLSSVNGRAPTPEGAVEAYWIALVPSLPAGRYIVIGAISGQRRQLRWNGSMWADVP